MLLSSLVRMPVFRPQILIADSDVALRTSLASQAEALGLSYLTAECVEEALHVCQNQMPQAIVMEVGQHFEGRDVLAALKKNPHTNSIRVFIVSSIDEPLLRHDCFRLGAEDYSLQPVDELFLRRLARKLGAAAAIPLTSQNNFSD